MVNNRPHREGGIASQLASYQDDRSDKRRRAKKKPAKKVARKKG
jgi:hypothetical protein